MRDNPYAANYAKTSQGSVTGDDMAAEKDCQAAGKWLFIGGAVRCGLAVFLALVISTLGTVARGIQDERGAVFDPEAFNPTVIFVLAAMQLIPLVFGVLIMWGAHCMRKETNRGWAFAAAILALLPVQPTLCLLLEWPFLLFVGIHALVVLRRPAVRTRFR